MSKYEATIALCRQTLLGRKGVIKSIADQAGCTRQTVLNALRKDNVRDLTEKEGEVMKIAAKMVKSCRKEEKAYEARMAKLEKEITGAVV